MDLLHWHWTFYLSLNFVIFPPNTPTGSFGVCLVRKLGLGWELLGHNVQYVIPAYTNKLDSDVLLFIYNTLPRSTTYIRLAFDASIKM